jgi:hypothetical protein
MSIQIDDLTFHPLTAEHWDDFLKLLGPNGAGGCWCMYWRLSRKDFHPNCRNQGQGNNDAMHALVQSGVVPGIIGYQDSAPVVWCSIAPREDFASLERSHNLKRLDDRPVWSIVCFYIAKSARKAGLMTTAIRAAVVYARQNGAQIVEAYPNDIHDHHADGDLYMGNLSAFLRAGFVEMDTRGKHKIVRVET